VVIAVIAVKVMQMTGNQVVHLIAVGNYHGNSSEDILRTSVKPLPPRILSRIRDRIEAKLDTELSLVPPRKRVATAERTSCARFMQPLG
jgi:hypothetical protein